MMKSKKNPTTLNPRDTNVVKMEMWRNKSKPNANEMTQQQNNLNVNMMSSWYGSTCDVTQDTFPTQTIR